MSISRRIYSINPHDTADTLAAIKERMLINALADFAHNGLEPETRYAMAFEYTEKPREGYNHVYDDLAFKPMDVELTMEFTRLPEIAIVEKGELCLIKVTEPIQQFWTNEGSD